MNWEINEVTKEKLADYAKIPMLFPVHAILEPNKIKHGLGGIELKKKEVIPYIKDLGKEEKPLSWGKDFDLTNWGFFLIYNKKKPIAGATVIYQSKEIRMLKNRDDICLLWDIRVHPDYKHQGIGEALFKKCESWARERNLKYMKIESQNNNIQACQFYVKMGCVLGEYNEYAYTGEDEHEIQLIWYKEVIE